MLDGLTAPQWRAPTRCVGWDVADVVLHLAQTDEMALASVTDQFADMAAELAESVGRAGSIDAGAAMWVERERGQPTSTLLARWSTGASRLVDALDAMDLSTRVLWVAGQMAARSLAATRLSETWIHTGDVADAVGIELPPTDRLAPIARLAWRTLPYAFAAAGRTMTGPVAFHLTAPSGDTWEFLPDGPALTTIGGPAADLCAVAARRIDPSVTALIGEGPDAEDVLAYVRTYAV